MENQIEKKTFWKKAILFIVVSIIITTGFTYSFIKVAEEFAENKTQILQAKTENAQCSFKRDSLKKEVQILSNYKALSKAMVHRDEALSLLKYKVGDAVHLKRDSIRVIIEDIIIGGSKYQYYIKYKISYKDKTTEDIIPELIY